MLADRLENFGFQSADGKGLLIILLELGRRRGGLDFVDLKWLVRSFVDISR